ncbi:MAG: hypothetical protein ACKV1O_08825 [Saprospiraceae bacterium]
MDNFLSKWSAFFHRIATRRNALLALAAQVLFSLVIFPAAQLRFDITGETSLLLRRRF